MAVHCQPCDRWFKQEEHLTAHLINSCFHNYCQPCARDFTTPSGKSAHLANSQRHQHCKWCRVEVGNLLSHYQREHEHCQECNVWFNTSVSLHEHCRKSHEDLYCTPCQRLFESSNNLRMHRLSATHQRKRSFCPSAHCPMACVSQSAVVLHLESGNCVSGRGLTQWDIDTRVAYLDRDQLILIKARLRRPIEPDLSSTTRGNYPCQACPKTFAHLGQLLSHLRSAKHANNGNRAYRCPERACRQTFPALSALLSHKERGVCGLESDEEVEMIVEQLSDDLDLD